MQPLVSIGLPVYNGENYVREALDSLLAQSYENFELIISDNASTDATGEICREYAARDPRIRYDRAAQNKGASWNFNRVLELSGGEFFMWAGHDDLWHPEYISKCVAALAADKDAVLCHSEGQPITTEGEAVGEPYIGIVNEGETMRERWRNTHENWEIHAAIYGVMRTETAKKVAPIETYASADLILISEIALHGKIIQIPEILQFKRLAPLEEARYKSPEGMMEYLGATKINKVWMHRFKVMRKCIAGLKHSGVSSADTLKMSGDIFLIYLKSQLSVDVKELIKSQLTRFSRKK